MKAPKVIIAGPPGGGKGTVCDALVEEFDFVHISSGDLLRAEVHRGTMLGSLAQRHMSRGELVPDRIVVQMIIERLRQQDVAERGALLDGFPRNKSQALALAKFDMKFDLMLVLDVPDSVLVERICGRRLDPVTKQIYHIKYKPPPSEVAGRVIVRTDDTEEMLKVRLAGFHKNTDDIASFYGGIMKTVNANQSISGVRKDAVACVSAAVKSTKSKL